MAAGTTRGFYRFAVLLCVLVVLLIAAGANVTSREAGLAVPDWPLSYGSLNPPRWWEIDNVRAEHGHRLFAGSVALCTVVLAVWAWRREPRAWVRRLSYLAVGAVLTQALLGGLTVLFFLPTPVSVGHALLAEVFLCLTVTVAVATSPSWRRGAWAAGGAPAGGAPAGGAPAGGARVRVRTRTFERLAMVTTGVVFLQIFIGAVMRHSGAGLAIPDFPLAFGRLVPPEFDFAVGVHYAHRLGALTVAVLVAVLVVTVVRRGGGLRRFRLPVLALAVLVLGQIALGATVIWTSRAQLPNTLHVATGATILATSLVLTLKSWGLESWGLESREWS